jgi:hypothetical protein
MASGFPVAPPPQDYFLYLPDAPERINRLAHSLLRPRTHQPNLLYGKLCRPRYPHSSLSFAPGTNSTTVSATHSPTRPICPTTERDTRGEAGDTRSTIR